MTGAFELLEHTADVGIRATGDSPEEVFDQAGLLVSWLDELLYLHESRDVVFGGFDVRRVEDSELEAGVRLAPRGNRDLEGVGVKAATYHRVRLEREPNRGWVADVYVDV